MAPNLLIGAEWRGQQRGVTREQLKSLIDELMDEAKSRRMARDALRGERAYVVGGALAFWSGQTSADAEAGLSRRLYRTWRGPFVVRDGAEMSDCLTAMIGAMQKADWRTARKSVTSTNADWAPAFGASTDRFYLCMTDQHLAAAALAIRWYAVENGGVMPKTLEELVPKYLPAVPRDPFAPGGKPIRYVADGVRPAVYSAGENGVDDGGSIERVDPMLSVLPWEGQKDHVVLLKRQPNGRQGPGVRWNPRTREVE